MQYDEWEVCYFQEDDGQFPTEVFIDSLQPDVQYPINRAIERLEKFGIRLRRPHVDKLRGKIWELIVKTHHGGYRFLYFFDKQKIVVTHGFPKKSGKTSDQEINKAIERRKRYLEQNKRRE
jgi:phage-related protein